ncbi:MAG: exo-alpha-sialidase [Faecousia sp.]
MISRLQKLVAVLLIAALAVSCLPAAAFAAKRDAAATEAVSDISQYRGETYTAPTKENYIFGGWYTDAELTQPLKEDVKSGAAYAKFVDAAVLTVKLQLKAGTTADSESTDLRLITTVDNLYYKNIGFKMTVNGATKDMSSRTVYKTITARNGEGQIDLQPTAFSPESQYFHTCSIVNISNAKFNDVIEIVPYWTTPDGTVVEGTGRSIKVSDGFTAAQTARYAISADYFQGSDGLWQVWTGSTYVQLADAGNAEAYAVTLDTATQKEGDGALQVIAVTDRDTNLLYKLHNAGNLKMTKESIQLKLWIYVSDPSCFDSWSRIQLSSNSINNDCLSWTLTGSMFSNGWNELTLNAADAEEIGTFDPASFAMFWFCTTGANDGTVIKLDDIRIEGIADESGSGSGEEDPVTECEHEKCRLCGGCTVADCDHTESCCSVKCPGEGNHPHDDVLTAPNVYLYWTDTGYDHLENGVDISEKPLGYMDGERRYVCNSGVAYVPNPTEEGKDRIWSSFITGDYHERTGNYIAMVTSGDDGETWTELSVVIEHPSEHVCVADGTLWTDPEGRLWVFWYQEYCSVYERNYRYDTDPDGLNPDGTYYSDAVRGVWCMYSEDAYLEEPTFSEPVRLCDGIMINNPTVATIEGKETWLLTPYMCSWVAMDSPAVSETQGPTLYTFSLGDDGVPTAEFYSHIKEDPYEDLSTFYNWCEPITVQLEDNSLMMLVRSYMGILVTRTLDPLTTEPYTGRWSELDFLRDNGEIVSRTSSRPHLSVMEDGTLLLVFHDVDDGSRSNMTVAISEDGGYTWTDRLLLDARHVSYPDLTIAPDGTIYIQYDFDRYGEQIIYLSRVTVEDIKAGSLVSEGSFINRIVNDNDYNKPFEYYTEGAKIEDTTGDWFGTNSGSNGYKKYGSQEAEGFTSYADGEFSVTSDGETAPTGLFYKTSGTNFIDSGTTLQNGALVFDLYIDDMSTFVYKYGIVSIGDNNTWVGESMGNRLTWDLRNVVYQSGWNEVWLNLKDAVSSGSAIDLSHIGGFWLYSTQVPADISIKVKNVRFVEKADAPLVCVHDKCPICGGCLKANDSSPITAPCTACNCAFATTYAIPMPVDNTSGWVGIADQWLATTNGAGYRLIDKDGVNTLTAANGTSITVNAGETVTSTTATGLMFLTGTGGKPTGTTMENGRFVLDVYIYDVAAFKTAGKIEVADNNATVRWTGFGNRLSWDLSKMNLVQGWNTLYLYLSDATQIDNTEGLSTTFDTGALMYFRVYTTNMPTGNYLSLKNISFQSYVCAHDKCPICGGCLKTNDSSPITAPCTACDCAFATTYAIPMPADNTSGWVGIGDQWLATTNGAGYRLIDKDGVNTLTAANGTSITVNAGETVTSTTATGLMFLTGTGGKPTGTTMENGRFVLDVYIYDVAAFKTAGKIEVADNNATVRWTGFGNRLSWDLSKMNLVQGWNTLYLYLSDATQIDNTEGLSTTFDTGALMYFRVYTTNMPTGNYLSLKNISFQEKASVE